DNQGCVTEGSSTNAWIVSRDGTLVTRALGHDILPGVTRGEILKIARAHDLKVEERAFTVAEAQAAREAFLTSTTAFAMPVIEIDGKSIGNGAPGLINQDLIRHYWRKAADETGLDLREIHGAAKI